MLLHCSTASDPGEAWEGLMTPQSCQHPFYHCKATILCLGATNLGSSVGDEEHLQHNKAVHMSPLYLYCLPPLFTHMNVNPKRQLYWCKSRGCQRGT